MNVGVIGPTFWLPRLVSFAFLFIGEYIPRAIPAWGTAFFGSLFFPVTTLVFSWARNNLAVDGRVPGWAWLLVIAAVVMDLVFWGLLIRQGRARWRAKNPRV